MRIDLFWGGSNRRLEVPDANLLGVLEPPEVNPFHDTAAELSRLAGDVADFSRRSRRVLVLVNDYTRPTPTARVLDVLRPVLREKETRYLVGLGTHRPTTTEELEVIFGSVFAQSHRAQIDGHDCRDRRRLFLAGRTRFGTDVWFNHELLWAEAIVAVNSIEPHYFAGFTGGRKSFLPGIAGHTSIAQNHNLVVRPGAATFVLDGNPVHEDMVEAARLVPRPVYSIEAVQDRNRRLLALHHGDLHESFARGCADARQVYAVPITEPADIVLSVLQSPYDINFYQSQRAVEFARSALKPRGIQITVSRCTDGIGNDGFIEVFRRCASAGEVLRCAEGDGRLGWHKSARLAQIMEQAKLYTVMGIEDSVVKHAFMHPFRSAQRALDDALASIGRDAKVYVIPDAGAVVPVTAATAAA